MNKIYRVVWNAELGQWVVASEVAKGRKKQSRTSPNQKAVMATVMGATLIWAGSASAQYVTSGGLVVCQPYGMGQSMGTQGGYTYNELSCTNNANGGEAFVLGNKDNTNKRGNVSPDYSTAFIAGYGDGTLKLRGTAGIQVQSQMFMNNYRISGLAEGSAGTDAVNVNQLNRAISGIPTGGNDANAVHYDDTTKAKVTLAGGTNGTLLTNLKEGSVASGSKDAVTGNQLFTTNQNVTNLTNNYNTLNTAVTSLKDDALLWKDTAFNAQHKGTSAKITNLAAGAVNATSTDAINGSQLYGTANSVATALGGGAAVDADGKVKPPTYTVAGNTYDNVGSAFEAIDENVAPKLKYIKFGYTNAMDATALGTDSVAIGGGSQATATGSLAIGNGARAMADNSVAIGQGSSATKADTFAVGSSTLKRRIVNVADGIDPSDAATVGQVDNKIAQALTTKTSSVLKSSTLLGPTAISSLTPDKLIVSGPNGAATTPTDAIGDKAVAMGLNAHANANNAVAAGQNVSVLGANGVAVGQNIAVGGVSAVAIGATVSSVSDYATAIGSDGTEVNTDAVGAVAIGRKVSVGGTGTVAIGSNIIAAGKNLIVLGSASSDDRRDNVVSVGSAGTVSGTSVIKRQIVNVAKGTLDTDAVNVSQLKGVTSALGGGAAVNTDGSVQAPTYTVNGNTYNDVGSALGNIANGGGVKYFHVKSSLADSAATGSDSIAVGPASKAQGTNAVAIGNGANAQDGSTVSLGGLSQAVGSWSVAVGTNAKTSQSNSIALGSNSSVTMSNSVALGDSSLADRANAVSVGKLGGERQIMNMARGTADTDAVNVAQLRSVTTALGGGATVNADGTVKQPTYTVNKVTYNDVGTAIEAAAASSGNVDALKWSTTASAYDAAHGATATNKIINVAAGTVSSTSKDAINGTQLYGVSNSVAAALGGSAAVNTDGTIKPPSYTVQGSTYTDVGSALGKLDGAVTKHTGDITTLNTRIDNLNLGKTGLVQQAAAGAKLTVGAATDGTQVDFTGTAGARQLKGLLKGTLDTDGVNVSQLRGITDALGGGAGVATDGSITKPTYTVDGKPVTGVDGAVTALDSKIGTFTDLSEKVKYIKFGYTTAMDATASGTNAVAIGGFAQALGDNALAIGANARVQATNSVAIGQGSSTTQDDAFAVGSNTKTRTIVNVSEGKNLSDAVTVGQMDKKITEAMSKFSATNVLKSSSLLAPTAISSLTPDKLIISGPNGAATTATDAIGDKAIAIGLNAHANANNAVAAGQNVSVLGANGVAVGQNIAVGGVSAVAIGATVSSVSDYAVAIGSDGTEVNTEADGAVAIGRKVSVGGKGTVAIGSNIVATGKNSLIFGSKSSDDGRDNILSVGSAGTVPGTSVIKRQIINVAKGTLDTDAVNLAQLKGVTAAIGGEAKVDANGDVVGPKYDIGGKTYTTVSDAINAIVAKPGVDALSWDTTSKMFSAVHDGTNAKITNLAAGLVGVDSTEAINGSQLHATAKSVADALGGSSAGVNADGTVKAPTYTLSGTTYATVGAALDAIDKKAVSGNVLGVTYDDATKGSITLGSDDGTGATIGNLLAGTKDDQAVNVAQLRGIADAIGGGAGIDEDGKVTAPEFEVTKNDGTKTKVDNVGEAISTIDGRVTTVDNRVTNVDKRVTEITNNYTQLSGDVLKWNGKTGAEGAYTAAHGDQATSRITNVADAIEQTDAVNKKTMNEAINKAVIEGSPLMVSYDSDMKDKLTLGGVKADGSPANAPVKLTNVAAGTGDTDAVNLKQLKDTGLIGGDGKTLDAVVYDTTPDNPKGSVTFGGANGTVLNNVADGLITANSRQAVNGGQLFKLQGEINQQITHLDQRVTNVEINGGGGKAPYISANPQPTETGKPAPANAGDTAGIAMGYDASASGEGASALGDHAVAQARDSVAIGNNSTVTEAATNSIALGNNSVADGANTLSIGAAGNERTISHVARGNADTDAATMGQVRESLTEAKSYTDSRLNDVWQGVGEQIDEVNRQANRGIAAASALINVTPYVPGHTTVNAGMANYRGETALGVGVSRWSDNGRVNFNAGVSAAKNDDPVLRVGIGYIF